MQRHLLTRLNPILVAFLVVMSCAFIWVFFAPITTTFNVTASTERIDIEILDETDSRLNFYEVEIYETDEKPIFKKFDGQLKLNKGTLVTIERVAFGTAILTFNAAKNYTVGTLFDKNSSFIRHTGQYLQVYIDDLKKSADAGQGIVLPIDGKVSMGRSVDFEIWGESSPVLKSGQINMTGSSTFSKNFDAGTTQLNLGDQIIFNGQSNKAIGFVTLTGEPGMQAAYRIIAKQAIILKSGPKTLESDLDVQDSGLVIQATMLDQLLKASSFLRISLFFGALAVLLDITTSLIEIGKSLKRPQRQ